MTIVKLPNMTPEEIQNLVNEEMVCRIAFKGDEYPYIAPFQFIILDDEFYFHLTNYGKKMKLISKDNRVCVSLESFRKDLSEYCFLAIRGKLEQVTDSTERARAIKMMAEQGRKQLSENFLSAHGLTREQGWYTLSPEKPLIIFKLVDIIEKVGLKSPK